MEADKILSIINNLLSKGVLTKVSKYAGVLADEIAACVTKDDVLKIIDKNILKSKENNQPNKIDFLENLKEKWDTFEERKKTKLLTLLKIENEYMCNILTSSILMWNFYNKN